MKKLVAVACIGVVFLSALLLWRRPRQRFELTDGSQVEIFYLGYGEDHEFDLRSPPVRLYELLPYSFRKKVSKFIPQSDGDWAAMGPSVDGNQSLGIGLRHLPGNGSARNLQDDARWILSDDCGWYFSGWGGSIDVGNGAYGAAFGFTPRDSKSLTLSVYTNTPTFDPGELLGSVSIPNPAHDAGIATLQEDPAPATIAEGNAEVELLKFCTGISLPDIPTIFAGRFDVTATDELTSGIESLLNGEMVAAEFPHRARTALAFKAYINGKLATQTLRNVRFQLTDASGHVDSRTNGILFRGASACALVLEYNLPTNSGNYDAELTLYEDPPAGPGWMEMPPLTPGASDVSSTKILALGTNTIHAGMSQGNSRIDLSATEDPSILAMRAVHTETSQPLHITPLQDGHWGKPYWCYAELAEPVTTGTVTLQFARAIEHKVKFSGNPERPDSSQ